MVRQLRAIIRPLKDVVAVRAAEQENGPAVVLPIAWVVGVRPDLGEGVTSEQEHGHARKERDYHDHDPFRTSPYFFTIAATQPPL
jgi:hypothetical protein